MDGEIQDFRREFVLLCYSSRPDFVGILYTCITSCVRIGSCNIRLTLLLLCMALPTVYCMAGEGSGSLSREASSETTTV